jgi:hypothetical protein
MCQERSPLDCSIPSRQDRRRRFKVSNFAQTPRRVSAYGNRTQTSIGLSEALPKNPRRTEVSATSNWQPWCRRWVQLLPIDLLFARVISARMLHVSALVDARVFKLPDI